MKKMTLVLATAAAFSLGSLLAPQTSRADPVTVIVVGSVVGWSFCYMTYGQKRVTPLCSWHDSWRKR
jgi:hypothetical protein